MTLPRRAPRLRPSPFLLALAFCVSALTLRPDPAFAAAEIDGWGDFRGIRVDGELAPFTTSLRATLTNGQTAFTATEMVKNPKWKRDGASQTSTGTILFENNQSLHFQITVEDIANNTARITIDATADADLALATIDYAINLPAADFSGGTAQSANAQSDQKPSPAPLDPAIKNRPLFQTKTNTLHLAGARRQIDITLDNPASFTVQNDQFFDTDIATQGGLRIPRDPATNALITVRFPLSKGNLANGQSVHAAFTLKTAGELDRKAIHLALNTAHPGPPFDGIGGNFRVYGNEDIAASEYNLTNLRVPLGRVAMPLSAWQPTEDADPIALLAQNGRGAREVQQCITAAKMVAAHGVPLIVTTWNMPAWALLAPGPAIPGRPFVIPARRPRLEKLPAVYDAIASYLKYLKSHEGIEAAYFSINEADLGIDILQTPEEHAEFIKQVGSRLEAAGLKTKLLLGDACSPHPVKFIQAAAHDPDALRYIGAVSFHSWHDGTDAEFSAWGDAAKKLNLPLFVGEGGTDADSYRYPAIFQEPWYGLYEADTYVRICALAQPRSILHWQMTANYSLLLGGGRSSQPLSPGRRFYIMKQLDLAPLASAAIPIASDSATVSACAFLGHDHCVVQLVNNGTARDATLAGLPSTAAHLHIYVTDADRGMQELPSAALTGGSATLTLPAASLTTLDASP